MAATVEVIIEGKDNTGGMFSSIGGGLSNLGNIVTGVKAGFDLLAGAFEGIVSFGSQFVTSAVESENAVAKLESVLKATGGAAGLTSQELQNMANELQKTTTFSDEAILSAESMLLTFRNIGEDTFPRATQAMLDMSQMFGGLESSSVQLGKALNDPVAGISALQRVGITFSDTQKDMIKNFVEMGDIGSAQAIILKEIEQQVGGLSQAMGQTFAGQVEILKNKFDTLKEGIGGLIIQGLMPLLSLVGPDTPIGIGFDIVSAALGKLVDYLDKGMPFFQSLGIIFMNLSKDADLVGIAGNLQAIGGAFLQMQDVLDGGGSMWDAAIAGIGNFSQALAQGLTDLKTTFQQDGFVQALVLLFDDIDVILADLVNNIDWATLGTSLGEGLVAMFGGSIESQSSSLAPALGRALVSLFKAAFAVLDPVLTELYANWETRTNQAIDKWAANLAADIKNGIINGLNNLDLSAQQWVDDHIINPIKRALGIASPSTVFMQIGRDIIGGLMAGFAAMISPLITLIDHVVSAILDPFQPILDFLGIGGGSGGTGSLGGMTGTHVGPGGSTTTPGTSTLGGTVVNQYFAGATINVGAWDEIAYDCIYPNPFIAATSGQLGGSTSGGNGGSGR